MVWTNDSSTALWKSKNVSEQRPNRPNSEPSFISVTPMGRLSVSGDRLSVPCGRAKPAYFELKTGMSARISFVRNVEDAILVSKDAVITDGDEQVVFVVVDGQVERRVIELGGGYEDQWYVRSGLEATELVVVTGNEDLSDGDKVLLTELPPPGPPTLPDTMKAATGDATGS